MNPLFAAIPAAGRMAAAQVVSAVEGGISQRAAIALIRSLGHPYSPTNPWGRLVSGYREAFRNAENLRSVNRSKAPNVSRLPLAVGDPRRKYTWTVRFDLQDEEGGLWEQHLSVSTDNPRMTVAQIIRAAEEALAESSGDPNLELIRGVLVGGRRRFE